MTTELTAEVLKVVQVVSTEVALADGVETDADVDADADEEA